MKIPTIEIPIFDKAFEFQIQTESFFPKGAVLALYIKRKKENDHLKYNNNDNEEDYHWSTYEFLKDTPANTEITFVVDGIVLGSVAGANKRYVGQIAIYRKHDSTRLETVQPVKFKTVTEIKS